MSPFAPSARQTEVLESLLAGNEPRRIAADLSLSTHTVGHHLTALRRLYGARTRLELVCTLWARRLAAKDVELEQEKLEHRRCRRDLAHLERRGRAE